MSHARQHELLSLCDVDGVEADVHPIESHVAVGGQRVLAGLGGHQCCPLLLREGEPHHRFVSRKGHVDDAADTELDAVMHENLVGARQRLGDRAYVCNSGPVCHRRIIAGAAAAWR